MVFISVKSSNFWLILARPLMPLKFKTPLMLPTCHFPSIQEENGDIPKTHLTGEESPCDLSTEGCSERKVIVPAIMAMGPMFIITLTFYSMAYDDINVIDDVEITPSVHKMLTYSLAFPR